ncbi:hypothetical protein T492DRAFT_870595 [Pavlovales sp. CCMP2436]|nr:hypothetical protein T492DRAFT_870595 [Pavlovales sp. CCMP2436]
MQKAARGPALPPVGAKPAEAPAAPAAPVKLLEHRLRVCQMRFASVNASGGQKVGELRDPAKVCVVDVRKPVPAAAGLCPTTELPDRLATLFDDEWLVDELFGNPTVAIMVTGGAQNFKMLPRVERVFRDGLVKAAQMTNAWVFTGGMASGVMKYVGEALANYPDIPRIGMALFGNVCGALLLDCRWLFNSSLSRIFGR